MSVLSSVRAAAMLAALPIASACVTRPQLGTEESGRRAVIWQNPSSAEAPDMHAEKETEQQLLAQARDAERKGTEDLALADTLYNLAILRRQQGNFAEAGQMYRRALEIRERKQGPNHPDVATVLNNLAALEAAQGRYDVAQPLLERVVKIRQTALGNEHVLTAKSLSNLALLYSAQGNATAAEPLYQRALAILEKTNDPAGGALDLVFDNYAALLRDTGRDREAEELEARARVIRAARGQQPDGAR